MLDPNLKAMGRGGGGVAWFGREKGAPSSRSVAKYEVLAHYKKMIQSKELQVKIKFRLKFLNLGWFSITLIS